MFSKITYVIYEEGPNSNELGPSSYCLYCTQHIVESRDVL